MLLQINMKLMNNIKISKIYFKKCLFLVLILFFIFLFAFNVSALVEPKVYYKLGLDYDNGNIKVNSIDIEFFNKDIENRFGFYSGF